MTTPTTTTFTFDLDPVVIDGLLADPIPFKDVFTPQFDPELAFWLSAIPNPTAFPVTSFQDLLLVDIDIVDLDVYVPSSPVTTTAITPKPCSKTAEPKTRGPKEPMRPAPYHKSGPAIKRRTRDRSKQRGHEDNYRMRRQAHRDTLAMQWASAENDLQQALTPKIAASQGQARESVALCERVRQLVLEERSIAVDSMAMNSVVAWIYLVECKKTKPTVTMLSEHKSRYAFHWS